VRIFVDPEALPFKREVLVVYDDQGQLSRLVIDNAVYRCHPRPGLQLKRGRSSTVRGWLRNDPEAQQQGWGPPTADSEPSGPEQA
jgi:hypothetical protein